MNFKEYIIKKGKHRSGIHVAPHCHCHFLHYQVVFESDCQYDLGTEDQLDINKLFGVSFGMHHKNSARFGWRSVGNQIELLAYCYVNKKREWTSLGLVNLNVLYNLKIYVTDDQYQFKVYNLDRLVSSCVIQKGKVPEYGYFLFPYFGGTSVAPHSMRILLRRLETKALKVFD